MQKSSDFVALARKMTKDLEANYLSQLEDVNLHIVFRPIYKHNLTIGNLNAIVAFVILAYSEDSPWINPRKDRRTNKEEILSGIGVDPSNAIYKKILDYEDDSIQQVILNFLLFHVDGRFREIINLLEFADKNFFFSNRRTSDKKKIGESKGEDGEKEDVYQYLDELEMAKVNKEKGELMLRSQDAREKAEKLLKQLETEYQKTDSATNGDFGFSFSNAKDFRIESWEARVMRRKMISQNKWNG